jgi:hypothetical protein
MEVSAEAESAPAAAGHTSPEGDARFNTACTAKEMSLSGSGGYMASKNDPETLSSRVQSSFQHLAESSGTLNSASDGLSKLVAELDSALKPLNIGLVCWVDIHAPWTSEDGSQTYREQLGYSKKGGKWGVALRTINEFMYNDDPDVEEWAFNDAPRQLRLRAVDRIPELLDEMVKQAAKFTKEIAEKTLQVQQLVSAIRGSTKQ